MQNRCSIRQSKTKTLRKCIHHNLRLSLHQRPWCMGYVACLHTSRAPHKQCISFRQESPQIILRRLFARGPIPRHKLCRTHESPRRLVRHDSIGARTLPHRRPEVWQTKPQARTHHSQQAPRIQRKEVHPRAPIRSHHIGPQIQLRKRMRRGHAKCPHPHSSKPNLFHGEWHHAQPGPAVKDVYL